MYLKIETGLGLEFHRVQQAFVLAYDNNCPLKTITTGRQTLKWTTELKSLRRGVRRLFSICRSLRIRIVWTSIERLSGITGRR